MHKPQKIKPTPCPECGSEIVFDKHVAIESVIRYKPIVCASCHGRFSFNPTTVSVFLMLSLVLCSLGFAVNFCMPYLQEIKQVYPAIKVYVLAAFVFATLTIAVLFKFVIPLLVKWQDGNHFRLALHYSMLLVFGMGFILIAYSVINGERL